MAALSFLLLGVVGWASSAKELGAKAAPAGTEDFAARWAAARAREFEIAEDPLLTRSGQPLYRARPKGEKVASHFVPPPSLAPLIAAVSVAVVNISAIDPNDARLHAPARSLGSGFIIDPEGYVVTNNHVVEGAEQIHVRLADGRELVAQVVGKDPSTDLALLHLIGDFHNLPYVYLGDSDELRVGDWVVAIGSPFGLDHTVSHGMISAKERVLGVGAFDDFIQTDAMINPGNSGGPLFDMQGDVVGVNTAIVSHGQGIGFAVPIDMVKDLLPNLKVNGHLARGWLGLTARDAAQGKGALVGKVYAGSPAAHGGIQPGDRIVQVNGKSVDSYLELLRKIALLPPGSQPHLLVVHRGTPRTVKVILSERPAPEILQTLQTLAEIAPAGLAAQDVTPKLADKLDLPVDHGVWVAGVIPGSTADRAGLREGDVIDAVDGKKVRDVTGYEKAVVRGSDAAISLHVLRGPSETKVISFVP